MGIREGSSTAEINAPLERVWELIADVERAPEWQGGMRSVVGRERDAEDRVLLADTETDAKVRTLRSQIRFIYRPPTRLSWAQVQGDVKSVTGSWELEPLTAQTTRATYRIAVDLGRLGLLIPAPAMEILRAQLAGARANELKAVIEG
jgi:carbon monoxide dehydrogenase subunit G